MVYFCDFFAYIWLSVARSPVIFFSSVQLPGGLANWYNFVLLINGTVCCNCASLDYCDLSFVTLLLHSAPPAALSVVRSYKKRNKNIYPLPLFLPLGVRKMSYMYRRRCVFDAIRLNFHMTLYFNVLLCFVCCFVVSFPQRLCSVWFCI